jgi:hypothetical protein
MFDVIRRLATAVAFAVALSACAGTDFSFEQARQVKPGMTAQQVTEIMGKPYMVTTRGDSDVWVWSHANVFSGAQSVSFILRDGVVTSVPKLGESFK